MPHETPAAPARRRVAFTFDDLPGLYVDACDTAAVRKLNQQLVAAIRRNRIPALGVVNEGKLCDTNRGQMASMFRIWLDAGLELGNHTYSHIDFNDTPLDAFEQDTLNGERVLRPLLASYGKTPRYFRYPMLHTGKDAAKSSAFAKFLTDHGYTNAVVTIDNDDYIYATVYAAALRKGDDALAKKLAVDYIRYMESIFAFYETFSKDTFGYEPPQILLLHDHQLNADTMDQLLSMTKRRGYSLVSITEALRDPIYRKPDTYTGGHGFSWLLRWAPDGPLALRSQPDVPGWVMDLFRNR